MSRKRLVSMVSGTVTCALAIGFFMQRGETAAPRHLVAPPPAPVQQVALDTAAARQPSSTLPPDLALASAVVPQSMAELPLMTTEPMGALINASANSDIVLQAPIDPDMPRLGCDVQATATPGPMAMVALEVSAPCFSNQRLTVHHSGMMFTDVTDNAGNLSVSIPALSEQAVFIVAFGNGKGSVALTKVPNLADFDRVVVQWTGDAGFQIHAREFGAAYGDTGHVWAGSLTGARSTGGMITQLGNAKTFEPQMAEVYSFPTNGSLLSGVVALSVEAEVNDSNCGRDISAQSLELRGSLSLRTRYLSLSMPNCTASGDFLVLNNLVDDLKIAAR